MYQKHKVLKEIGTFIKRHIVICVICVLSAFIIAKNSLIPVPDWMPKFFKKLLLCPQSGTAPYEWSAILNDLSLAFLASIIVYIIVQYIPERRKANKAFSLLQKEFVSLYSYMSKLISMYLFELGIDTPEKNLTVEQVSGICCIELSNRERKCRINHLRNGKPDNSTEIGYALYKDSLDYCNYVKTSLEKIKSTLCSANLDIAILNSFSKIENNWFLNFFLKENPYILKTKNKTNILNFDKGFIEFVECHLSLSKYSFDRIGYSYIALSEEEFCTEQEKALFIKPRSVYLFFGKKEVGKITTEINNLEPTELRLKKCAGVMLEMLVFYDFEEQKPDHILNAAKQIAEYIFKNETDQDNSIIAFLNLAQIKKRMGILTTADLERLHQISSDTDLQKEIRTGSAIICDNYDLATKIFNQFTEEKKCIFVQLPIYHLWNNPPMEPNPNPMNFLYMGEE